MTDGLKPNRIAHGTGSAWDDMGGGISGGNNRVHMILESGGNEYVSGNFTNAGGLAARNVAYWDGSGCPRGSSRGRAPFLLS